MLEGLNLVDRGSNTCIWYAQRLQLFSYLVLIFQRSVFVYIWGRINQTYEITATRLCRPHRCLNKVR